MRAGDTVTHTPTGETWTVAYVDGEDLAWCGWPPGYAKVSDCVLVKACSDEEHIKMLRTWAAMDGIDLRISVCRRQLKALEARGNISA